MIVSIKEVIKHKPPVKKHYLSTLKSGVYDFDGQFRMIISDQKSRDNVVLIFEEGELEKLKGQIRHFENLKASMTEKKDRFPVDEWKQSFKNHHKI